MKRRTLVAAGLVLPAIRPVVAQDAYPSKPIQIFVPFPPGGVADITARPLAHVMGRLVKQSIVVVNKPGAGGSVGAAQAARAAPDGYTLLLALSSISVLPVADRLQGRPAGLRARPVRARRPDQRRSDRCWWCAPTVPTRR